MFDGNRFFPEAVTPMRYRLLSSTRLALWLPVPLTVATRIEKS
jgi:hypothetical protein